MTLIKDRDYMVNGERMTFVRQFNARGIVRRFAYPSQTEIRHCVDFGPGEITRLEECDFGWDRLTSNHYPIIA